MSKLIIKTEINGEMSWRWNNGKVMTARRGMKGIEEEMQNYYALANHSLSLFLYVHMYV